MWNRSIIQEQMATHLPCKHYTEEEVALVNLYLNSSLLPEEEELHDLISTQEVLLPQLHRQDKVGQVIATQRWVDHYYLTRVVIEEVVVGTRTSKQETWMMKSVYGVFIPLFNLEGWKRKEEEK